MRAVLPCVDEGVGVAAVALTELKPEELGSFMVGFRGRRPEGRAGSTGGALDNGMFGSSTVMSADLS
jgi:hypothetical protein